MHVYVLGEKQKIWDISPKTLLLISHFLFAVLTTPAKRAIIAYCRSILPISMHEPITRQIRVVAGNSSLSLTLLLSNFISTISFLILLTECLHISFNDMYGINNMTEVRWLADCLSTNVCESNSYSYHSIIMFSPPQRFGFLKTSLT